MRNDLIDAFRGLDLLEMQTTEICDSKFFDHAVYDDMKMSYADTVFPCFAFISGMTLNPQKKVPLRRNIQLIGLGIMFNGIPLLIDNQKLRFLGVLQRHGLSSIILNNVVPMKLRASFTYPFIMTGLWYLLSIGLSKDWNQPFKNPENTAQLKIDKAIFGSRTFSPKYDPEGLLGALMTSITIWSGSWFMQRNWNVYQSLLFGLGSMAIGKLLPKVTPSFGPISKPLWTPSFVLVSNGWSIVKYSLFSVLFPYLPQFMVNSLVVFGRSTMEIYFLGELLMILTKDISPDCMWSWASKKLNKFLLPCVTSTILVSIFDSILVGSAHIFYHYGIRIRFF